MTAAAIAALLLTGLAACGGDDGGAEGGLSDALGAVSASPAAEQSFAFTDLSAVREVAEVPTPGEPFDPSFRRWLVPATLGAPAITQNLMSIEGGQDVDLYGAERFVTIGFGGDGATRIDGFQGDSAPLTGLLDASTAEGDTVVIADEEAARDAALGDGDERLGDRAEYAAAADCLGDVLAAQISPAQQVGVPADAGKLVAVGVRGGDEPADVLCVVGDGDQAERSEQALRSALDPDAVSRATNRHISDEVEDVAFATGGDGDHRWARVITTPHADSQMGYLYRSVYQMMLARSWYGSS